MLVSNGTIRPPLIMYLFEIRCCYSNVFLSLFVFSVGPITNWCYNDNLVDAKGGGGVREKFRFPGGGGGGGFRGFFRECYYANLMNYNFSEGIGVAFRSAHSPFNTNSFIFSTKYKSMYSRVIQPIMVDWVCTLPLHYGRRTWTLCLFANYGFRFISDTTFSSM